MPDRRTARPPASEHRRAAPRPAEVRRSEIIAAALPLLLHHGEAATTRELARAAGVSEGTLFNVFAGKDDLIAAAVETALDQEPFERAVRAIDPSLDVADTVVAAVRLVQERTVENWQLLSALGPRHTGVDRPLPVSPALTELFERLDLTRATHADDAGSIHPGEAARLLRSLTLALTHPLLCPEAMEPERITAIFLHGVRGTGARSGTGTSTTSDAPAGTPPSGGVVP